jgi:hypothetical protein
VSIVYSSRGLTNEPAFFLETLESSVMCFGLLAITDLALKNGGNQGLTSSIMY